MKIYKDNFGNTAKIERLTLYPYRGAPDKTPGFRLWIESDYNNLVYFVSIYETFIDAKRELNTLSAGTFKEVLNDEH